MLATPLFAFAPIPLCSVCSNLLRPFESTMTEYFFESNLQTQLYSLNSRNSLITSIKLSIIFGTLLEHSTLCNEKNHYPLIQRWVPCVIAQYHSRYCDRYTRGTYTRSTLRAMPLQPFWHSLHRRRKDVYERFASNKRDSPRYNTSPYLHLLAQHVRRYSRSTPRNGDKSIHNSPLLSQEGDRQNRKSALTYYVTISAYCTAPRNSPHHSTRRSAVSLAP